MRRWRLLVAIPAVAALPLMGAAAASAAPAHVQTVSDPVAPNTMAIHAQVSPDTDGCESGYGIWQDYDGYYLGQSGVKVGQALKTTTGNNYCWLFPANDSWGFIQNEAGYCAGFDSATGNVNLQDCNTNATFQEWYLTNTDGVITLLNLYAYDNGYTSLWMAGYGNDDDVSLGGVTDYTLWQTCAPPGPC
jgi:hypothetical protein